MKTGKILLSGLILSLSIIVFSCYVFENPLDPEAANYQGFQTVATVNEVVLPDEEIILDASSDEMEIAVAYCPDATTYEIKIYRTPAYTSPYYEAYSETNIFDLASADLYNGLWYCTVRAYSSNDGYWGTWSTYSSFEVTGSNSDDDSNGDSEETEAEISISQGTADIPLNGTYDFGSVLSGSSKTVTFTIGNSGTAALNLTGNPVVTISGTNASEFSVTAQPATPVASGGTTTFTVTFSPQSEGSKTATVTIANNDSDEGAYSFTLNGARSDDPEPEINVKQGSTNIPSGGSYDFGDVETGSSASVHFTIENIGTAALNLTGNPVATISGTNASEFSVTAQPETPVASGGTTTFTVTFSPQSEGSKTATVTIANNDSDEGAYSFTLNGAWSDEPEPEINVKQGSTNIPSGGSYDFGDVETGSSASAYFTIENPGTAALNLTGSLYVAISGTDASEFSVTAQPATSSIASGDTATFTITFSPQSEGTKSATVTIANNDSDEGTYSFTLNGARSDNPEPEINVKQGSTNIPSGGSYDFGDVETGSSASAYFTIENLGTAALNLTGSPYVAISGTDASEFSVTAQPETPVATGDTATFTITFSPQSTGSKTATVTIASNDADEGTYSFTIGGTGTEEPDDENPVIDSFSIEDDNQYTDDRDVTLQISASDNVGVEKMRFSNNESSWTTYDYGTSYSWELTSGDGPKTVYAQVQDSAENWSSNVNDTITLDTTDPSVSKFSINDGDTYTKSLSVDLQITASDSGSGIEEIRIKNSGGSWEAFNYYTTEIEDWELDSGDGTKRVYMRVYDKVEKYTAQNDTIILDTTPPSPVSVRISDGDQYTNSRSVTLQISASDSLSGVSKMRLRNYGSSSWTTYDYTTQKIDWSLTDGDGEKRVYAQAQDGAGNWNSVSASDIITLDTKEYTIFSESFGDGDSALDSRWTIGSNSNTPKWGEREVDGSYIGYCADRNNTLFPNEYENNMSTWMDKRNVSLVGFSTATLKFWTWYEIENGDYFYIYVRDENGNWDEIKRWTGDTNGWQENSVDLSDYCGQSGLYIQFLFTSNSSGTAHGVEIDNISLEALR